MQQTKMGFQVATPEERGVPSGAILAFLQEIRRQQVEVNGVIMMRRGAVIAEGYFAPFAADKSHRLFSAGKALVALAILFAVQEGRLQENGRVIDLLPGQAPKEPSENLRQLTLYHLLTMTTGHAVDPFGAMLAPGADRARVFFETPFVYAPGTHFLYDNGVPDLLGMILYQAVGQSVYEYLQPRLFEPLELTGMRVEKNGPLDELPTMCSTTRDLFKITLLLAQGGRWNGRQLLEERLVRDATAYQTPSLQSPTPPLVAYDTQFGYGYQIWRNSVGGFRIDGGRGQFGIVVPEMELVVAIQSSEEDQGIIPRLLWQYVTNRLHAKALAPNPVEQARLAQALQTLSWAPPQSEARQFTGAGHYRFETECLGCTGLRVEQKRAALALVLEGQVQAAFEVPLNGGWQSMRAPFVFHPGEAGKGVRRLDRVAGYDPAQVYVCARLLCENSFELHFRSDAWMDGCVLTFTLCGQTLQVCRQGTLGYNQHRRSAWVANPLLQADPRFLPVQYRAKMVQP